MTDLSTVARRKKLKARREPYWTKLAKGQFLGFRPSAIGKGGHWIARYYDADTRRQLHRALGDFGDIPDSERHGVASRVAREWFDHLARGGSRKVTTVRHACEVYSEGSSDADGRFRRWVYSDPIAKVELSKLTKAHVREWRKRLEAAPALVTRSKTGRVVYRPRSPASVNRDMTALRAALNAALDRGEVLNDQAWRVTLKPIRNANKRRNLYLDREQRRTLLEALPEEDIKAFVTGLIRLPLRPGALAALTAGDFDRRNKELVVGKDKNGADRRILVPDDLAKLLARHKRGKLPGAPLFVQANGKPWNKYAWNPYLKKAARATGLPDGVTAYTLRHSTITDLVQGGLDLITVAQLSGTSVATIEKHYAHLQKERAAEALAGLAL